MNLEGDNMINESDAWNFNHLPLLPQQNGVFSQTGRKKKMSELVACQKEARD